MFNHAVILAAGKGERMKPLTDYWPKALVEINSRPLITHTFDSFHKSGFFPQVHVTIGHLSHLVTKELNGRVSSFIDTKGRSNTWFLFNSLIKNIHDDIIYVPCDLVFEIDWVELYLETVMGYDAPIGIVTVPYKDGTEADFVTSYNGKCKKIDRAHNTGVCASGIQIINPRKINNIFRHKSKPSTFNEIWEELIKREELTVFKTQPSSWKAYDRLNQI